MRAYRKPVPVPDDLSRPFWDGARRHELVVLRCAACGCYVHHPRPSCPRCAGGELRPTRVSGRGTLYSFTVSHYVGAPGFEDEVPYVIVIVELEEQVGLRIVGNLRDCPRDAVRVGMPLEVLWEDVTPEITLPQFRPRQR